MWRNSRICISRSKNRRYPNHGATHPPLYGGDPVRGDCTGHCACFVPAKARDYSFTDLVTRLREEHDCLEMGIVLGPPQDGFMTVEELVEKETAATQADIDAIKIDPEDPAVFQLSGGTTGIPKLIPRTHNDYICNTKLACASTETGPDKVLLDILPIGHNLPLACPGMQGFLMKGGTVVFAQSTRGETLFPLIEKHGVTHIHCVPALLIRWIHDPGIGDHDLSSLEYLQSGGQRLQPEVRRRTYELIPSVFVQENFGMAEGMLFFAEKHHEEAVRMETVGFPVCEDDEVRIVDEEDNVVPFGEVGEMCCRVRIRCAAISVRPNITNGLSRLMVFIAPAI